MESTNHFRLRPFAAGPMTENLSLTGYLARRPGAVQIMYRMEGVLDGIHWPRRSQKAGRCHALWRQTCFELFFGITGDSAYWEVNINPNNCWNVYHFTDYRSQMQEEKSIRKPLCHLIKDAVLLTFTCTIDCSSIVDDSADLEVGICSVIQAKDGSTSYWAIDHHGTVADFHNRASFSMVLPGVKKSTL